METKKKLLSEKCEERIYKHPMFIGDKRTLQNGAKTLLECWNITVARNKNEKGFGTIINNSKIQWTSRMEADVMVKKLACYLFKMTEEGDLIGIYSINRLEWIIAEYASYELKCINCPLYSTYGPESIS
ncbi:Long-chain-fatty-acid--CoA ligase 5, partial [Astathelohania contejeani]